MDFLSRVVSGRGDEPVAGVGGVPRKKPSDRFDRSGHPDLLKCVGAPLSRTLAALSEFTSNDGGVGLANAFGNWEKIPRYFFSREVVQRLRTSDGKHGEICAFDVEMDRDTFQVEIHPALIRTARGGQRAYYPGLSEEMLEEVLKKLLADTRYGLHDLAGEVTAVRFSYGLLRRELEQHGRLRNNAEIAHSLKVMQRCHLSVSVNGVELYAAPLIPVVQKIDPEIQAVGDRRLYVAQLPPLITQEIEALGYRQFNYRRLMSMRSDIARWMYKRLVLRYSQASIIDPYDILFSTIATSRLLQQGTDRQNRLKVKQGLEELVVTDVLLGPPEAEPRKEGRRIVDVRYRMFASETFAREQKAANHRAREHVRCGVATRGAIELPKRARHARTDRIVAPRNVSQATLFV